MTADLSLARQRCWTHPAREAAARCPSCTRFYCRECVTEHDGRLLCAGCLRASIERASGKARSPRRASAVLGKGVQLAAGLAVAWLFFYLLAQGLLSVPSAFHEGSLWIDRASGPSGDEP